MPIITSIKNFNKLGKELLRENPKDIRKWTRYQCIECDHRVGSDIPYQNLYCIKCGDTMEKY